MQPPTYIDGALVLEWAWSDTPFGKVSNADDNGFAVAIHGLAICQYEGSSDVYRFCCNAHWETEQDESYASIEHAKSELPKQYRQQAAIWHKAN